MQATKKGRLIITYQAAAFFCVHARLCNTVAKFFYRIVLFIKTDSFCLLFSN
jgi:hypothetical protein